MSGNWWDYDFNEATYDDPLNHRANPCVDEQVHPFDDLRLLQPFLEQDKYWCNRGKEYIAIADMSTAHALNAYRLLVSKAVVLWASLYHSSNDAERAQSAILDFPLTKALWERANEGKEIKYPWEKVAAKKKK